MSNRSIYREKMKSPQMVSFKVNYKETDLWVAVDEKSYNTQIEGLLENYIITLRGQLDSYIRAHPLFRETLEPYFINISHAPDIVLKMVKAANPLNVGPMAAVAGAFSEMAGEFLLQQAKEVIVENGGDIYLKSEKSTRIGIYAGNSPLSGTVAMEISPKDTPMGVCTSSGTFGHSYSRGKADAVVILSSSAPLADAAATAVCNSVNGEEDIKDSVERALDIKGVKGAIIICGQKMAAGGAVRFCSISS